MNTFPVTESTLSARHLTHLLREKYDLSENAQCKLFRTGINHLYMVTDADKKYVFRVYTYEWRTKTAIAAEIILLLHLKENDIPVSYPIADSNGDFIHELNAPEGTRYGVLFSFAEGRKIPRFTPLTSYHIGVAMARMHQVTENFEIDRVSYNAKTLLTAPLTRTKAFFTNQPGEMAFVEQLTDYLVKAYENADTSDLRTGAIHLDIWFDNMHFNGETEITIFDFDFCGNGWLCFDIAYYLFQLFYTNPDVSDSELKTMQFLAGYESVTKITAEEKRMIPTAALGVFLFYLATQCDKYDTWSNIFLNEDHLKRFLGNLRKWIAYNNIIID